MHVLNPTNKQDAIRLRLAYPGSCLLAGGTDMLARWNDQLQRPETVICLGEVPELTGIQVDAGMLHVGAMTSFAVLSRDPLVNKHFPILGQAAAGLGAPAVRNMATIGGNIANGSPAADLPPVMIAYQANYILESAKGRRSVPADEFYLAWRTLDLGDDEILTGIDLPLPPPNAQSRYYRLGTRRAQSCSKVSLAGYIEQDNEVILTCRLAAASVAATPLRLTETEKILMGEPLTENVINAARAATARMIFPISDLRSTAEYRTYVLERLISRFLHEIMIVSS
jgi:carbon-monoxide dehydrogenase small subunit/xanthine dehydrogenase small subunit